MSSRKNKKNRKRKRFFRKLFWFSVKAVAIASISLVLFIVIAGTSFTLFVTNQRLQEILIVQVAQNTGGKLEIGNLEYGLQKGIVLDNVLFFPPLGEKGYLEGGPIHSKPMLMAKKLEVSYDLGAAVVGKLIVSAVRIKEPLVKLSTMDKRPSWQGILEFREKLTRDEEKKPEQEAQKEESAANLILPFHPKNIFMPFLIDIRNVGIKGLSLHYVDKQDGQIQKDLLVKGISFAFGMFWQGFESKIQFLINDGEENEFQVIMEEAQDKKGLVETFYLDTEVSLDLSLVNLSQLLVRSKSSLIEMSNKNLKMNDMDFMFDSKISLTDDLSGLEIEKLMVKLMETGLIFNLAGSVAIEDLKEKKFRIDLNSFLRSDLDQLKGLTSTLGLPVEHSGVINMDDLTIRGPVFVDLLSQGDFTEVPVLELQASFDNVTVKYPPLLDLKGLDGKVITDAVSKMGELQSDFHSDLSLAFLALSPSEKQSVAIKGLFLKAVARARYPENSIPFSRVEIDTESVKLKLDNKALATKLYLNSTSSLEKMGEAVSLAMRTDLDSLLELTVLADCLKQCDSLRANGGLRITGFEKILDFVRNNKALKGNVPEKFFPEKIDGKISIDYAFKGQVKELKEKKLELWQQNNDFQYRTNIKLENLGLSLPFKKIEMEDFDTTIEVEGDLKNQQFVLQMGFEKLGLIQPVDKKLERLQINDLEASVKIKNQLLDSFDWSDPGKGTETDLAFNLGLGRLFFSGHPLARLNNLSTQMRVNQLGLKLINVRKTLVKVPDFGVELELSGNTEISNEFLPKRADLTQKLLINQSQAGSLPFNLDSSGAIRIDNKLATDDMKNYSLDGQVSFEHFNLTKYADIAKTERQVDLKDAHGAITLRQTINIERFLKPEQTESDLPESLEQTIGSFLEKDTTKESALNSKLGTVSYISNRPFYPERNSLRIKRLEAANLALENLEFDIEVKQNQFSINQLLIGFLGGKIQGDFQLEFDPMPKKMKTSIHLTRLNTRKLLDSFPQLKDKSGGSLFSQDPFIDATVHLGFDPRTSDMSGSVVLTSIGKEQLKMILYYVDPNETDATINDVRTALNLGSLQQVAMVIRNGEMNLDIDIDFVDIIPLPVPSIERVPLTKIVNNIAKSGTDADSSTL